MCLPFDIIPYLGSAQCVARTLFEITLGANRYAFFTIETVGLSVLREGMANRDGQKRKRYLALIMGIMQYVYTHDPGTKAKAELGDIGKVQNIVVDI
jgi:hypothetical protein